GRSDQYALAVMAYELLADRLPFDAPDPMILARCVLNEDPLPIDNQPQHVNAALRQALAKTRGERFANCVEFMQSLAEPGRVGPVCEENVVAPAELKKTPPKPIRIDQRDVNVNEQPLSISFPDQTKNADQPTPKPPPLPKRQEPDSSLTRGLAEKLRETATTGKEQMRREKLVEMLFSLQRAHATIRRSRYVWLLVLQAIPCIPPAGMAGGGIAALFYEMIGYSADAQAAVGGIVGGTMALTLLWILLGLWRRKRYQSAVKKLETVPREIAYRYPIECEAWGGVEVLEHEKLVRQLILALIPPGQCQPTSGIAW
ncbi:MAG: hypothetical protein ACREIV_15690, partial [Planctomycetaceae bacterium]